MMAVVFLLVLALVFALVWISLGRKSGPQARIGPDGTNVREPETFVVHHHGRAEGLDIANRALEERTENLSPDMPGDADRIRTPIPGRDMTRLDSPPSDRSRYGAEKVAPKTGQEPGGPRHMGRHLDADCNGCVQFELGGDLMPNLNDEISLPPSSSGEDTVTALVRNPRSLYIYWERSGFGDENLHAMVGEQELQSVPVLRVFDITAGQRPGQTESLLEIGVGEQDDHWFLNDGLQPSRRYVVSYGRRLADGRYYMLSHSAPVQMPHDGPARRSILYQQYGRQTVQWSDPTRR